MILRIRDWDLHFENSSSRKLKRLDWVAVPNKTDGEGYTALVDHPNAAAHLGAWLAIVEVASKQAPSENRGNLPGGICHDIGGICRSLGRMSRLPAKVFEEALPRLIEIGWLEDVDATKTESNQQNVRSLLAESADTLGESADVVGDSGRKAAAHIRELQGTTGKGIEGKENGNARTPAVTRQRFQEWIRPWPRNPSEERALHAFVFAWTAESDSEIFACRDRYLKSADVADGVCQNPENFLNEQKQNNWAGKWPMPSSNSNGKHPSLTDRTKALWADRIAKGERPI